jgi:6-phosphogluconolactonase (cycloisomerase 2 family)
MESARESRGTTPSTRRIANVVVTLSLALGVARAAAAQPVGALAQLPRPDACTQLGGDGINCRDGIGLNGANDVALSPDGKSVYVAALFSDTVAVFARDKPSGALTQLAAPNGCVANDGDGVTCQDAVGLSGPTAVTVSPDNAHVYVASYGGGLTVFNRNPMTGALTQLAAPDGCITQFGGGTSGCTDAYGPFTPTSLLVSPDGKFVYTLARNSNSIGVFARDKATGKLTQLPAPEGCLSLAGDGVTCKSVIALDDPRGLAMSRNGKSLYVAAGDSDAIAIFRRNKTTGVLTQPDAPNGCIANDGDGVTCTAAIGLDTPTAVLVGKNNRHVYAVSYTSDSLTIFERNQTSGALTQLPAPHGCLAESGDGITCTDAVALNGGSNLTQSNNGRHLYVTSIVSGGVAAFRRDKTSGEIEQLYYPNACTIAGGDNVMCRPGLAVSNARAVAVSNNGKHVYLASYGDDAVAAFTRKR